MCILTLGRGQLAVAVPAKHHALQRLHPQLWQKSLCVLVDMRAQVLVDMRACILLFVHFTM
jgi:hypothetical protein